MSDSTLLSPLLLFIPTRLLHGVAVANELAEALRAVQRGYPSGPHSLHAQTKAN